MLGRNCFEAKDFRGRGKTIFFREKSEQFITVLVKENITTKTKATSYAKSNKYNLSRQSSKRNYCDEI